MTGGESPKGGPLVDLIRACRHHRCDDNGSIQNEGGDHACALCEALFALGVALVKPGQQSRGQLLEKIAFTARSLLADPTNKETLLVLRVQLEVLAEARS